MKRALSILLLLLASAGLYGQTTYTGFIDKYPVELVIYVYGDGEAQAIYAYTNIDEPITLDGKLQQNKLTLVEKDKANKNSATLVFDAFDVSANNLQGKWTDLKTGKQYGINLSKELAVSSGVGTDKSNQEILQPVSLAGKYIKLLVSNAAGDLPAKVSGVRIYEKRSDRLLQQIAVDCQLIGLNNVSTGDYNFDGLADISVFESSYAGPNTSSLYFLYDRKTGQFRDSGFSGTSLEFDSKTKRVYERNQCCAGTSVITAEYKVVLNKMVLVKQRCYKWDEKKQALVERQMRDCQ